MDLSPQISTWGIAPLYLLTHLMPLLWTLSPRGAMTLICDSQRTRALAQSSWP